MTTPAGGRPSLEQWRADRIKPQPRACAGCGKIIRWSLARCVACAAKLRGEGE